MVPELLPRRSSGRLRSPEDDWTAQAGVYVVLPSMGWAQEGAPHIRPPYRVLWEESVLGRALIATGPLDLEVTSSRLLRLDVDDAPLLDLAPSSAPLLALDVDTSELLKLTVTSAPLIRIKKP
jgi:hypothetical protein